MRTHSILPAILLLSLTSSCAKRIGDFSTLSNRNVMIADQHGAPVVGRDCTWRLFAIPFEDISLEQAVDNAIAHEPRAEYLADVTVRETGWWFGKTCFEVRGTPVWRHESAPAAAPVPDMADVPSPSRGVAASSPTTDLDAEP